MNNELHSKFIQYRTPNKSFLSPILPISHKASLIQNENIPFEMETPYKSFQEEFYTIRSNWNPSPLKSKRPKIFEERQTPALSVQQIVQVKEPQRSIKEFFFKHQQFLQAKEIKRIKEFKYGCMQTEWDQKQLLYDQDGLRCEFSIVNQQYRQLNCTLILTNIKNEDINNIDVLVNTDSTLQLNQSDEFIKVLHPQQQYNIKLKLNLLSYPFTFANVSIDLNSKKYIKLVLPITIFNFGQLKQINNKKSDQFRNEWNMRIQSYDKTFKQQLINRLFVYNILECTGYIEIIEQNTQLQIICQGEEEQINIMILNTLYFLLSEKF